MIMTVVTTTKPPIQANFSPASDANVPIGPRRAPRPRPNSAIRRGRDHATRKTIHGMRKAAPPFCAAILGKRQRLPVPTAIPRPATITAPREEKVSDLDTASSYREGF